MFLPTDGLSTIVVIDFEVSSARSPIPDSWRIWGVPKDPAERMTSLRAKAVVVGAKMICQRYIRCMSNDEAHAH
jgi:hypothetical protein